METRMTKREDQRLENVQERPGIAPRVDIFENKDELLLIADVPGVVDKGLTIRLERDELFIEGRLDEEKLGDPLDREFHMLDYRRSFFVPQGIDRARIAAELKNGVLLLHLPKSDASKPRKIDVRAG